MSVVMEGWIAVDRSVWTHEIFAKEKFSEREAWLWIISNAAWSSTTHRVGSSVQTVPRGSFFCTERSLCQTFGWGNTKLRNFLSILASQGMVQSESKAGKTLLSVCNYNKFQDVAVIDKAIEQQNQSKNKAQAKQKQSTKETNKQKNKIIVGVISAREISEFLTSNYPDCFSANPSLLVTKSIQSWLDAGATADLIKDIVVSSFPKNGNLVHSWAYFDSPIRTALSAQKHAKDFGKVTNLESRNDRGKTKSGGFQSSASIDRLEAAQRAVAKVIGGNESLEEPTLGGCGSADRNGKSIDCGSPDFTTAAKRITTASSF